MTRKCDFMPEKTDIKADFSFHFSLFVQKIKNDFPLGMIYL